ncbi:MAG: ATP-dependent DNA helicase RecG [Zoogloeaceae bacterium]|jgi:ATP-dependent DNA helicase RecG|nr:ATP-dependent DNA helicase RecG [Zoogloeaceae bacterium]
MPKKPPAKGLADKLKRLGLVRREDFLLHFPLRYEDLTRLTPIAEARRFALGEQTAPVQIEGVVADVRIEHGQRRQLVVQLAEGEAAIVLRFLHFYPKDTAALAAGNRIRAYGLVRHGFFGAEIVHPRYRLVEPGTPLPTRLTPVYPTTAGIAQIVLLRRAREALMGTPLAETLPEETLARLGLPTFWQAIRFLHAPPAEVAQSTLDDRVHPAWQRIKLDELLAQQISLKAAAGKRRSQSATPILASGELSGRLLAALPFAPTKAQQRAAEEIRADLSRAYPMQRLLQGDVGAGKTLVAALAICAAIEAGQQAAFMAPTEILAEQHLEKLSVWFAPLGVEIAWLSGALTGKKREAERQKAQRAPLVIGTHALLSEGVEFERLGLVVIDEQHRFGVAQRLALRKKGGMPHQLMMSATPIPRTLAMSYFADLDVSVLDELPPGRKPVETRLFREESREKIIAHVRHEAEKGRQSYWVCPLIEESEALQLQTAQETFALLEAALPELQVGLVHGRLKPAEKQAAMADFVAGKTDVLVATTVIEVGVDVPNASLMVIEHAERFGLSQLHQLRGRIGRGSAQSACLLLYAQPLSETAKARLKIIREHSDGFEIAREDLKLRGPGEFIGARQSGLPMLRYADLETDVALIETARDLAADLLKTTPQAAAETLRRWLGGSQEFLAA